jgi:hypothetical protein
LGRHFLTIMYPGLSLTFGHVALAVHEIDAMRQTMSGVLFGIGPAMRMGFAAIRALNFSEMALARSDKSGDYSRDFSRHFPDPWTSNESRKNTGRIYHA